MQNNDAWSLPASETILRPLEERHSVALKAAKDAARIFEQRDRELAAVRAELETAKEKEARRSACRWCLKEFYRLPGQGRKREFCSAGCRLAMHRRKA